jgi:Flp pilus assembly protein TadG
MQKIRHNRGQNIVETALVLPVFLVLLALAIDGGRAYHTYMRVQQVAREAAFYGAAHGGDVSATEDKARTLAENLGLDTDLLEVMVTEGSDGDDYVVVSASYRMDTILLGMAGYRTFVLRDSAKAMVLRLDQGRGG